MKGPEERQSVLLGINDSHIASLYSDALVGYGHTVRLISSLEQAKEALLREHFDVLIIETSLGGRHAGLELAQSLLQDKLHPEIIVLANYPNVAHAVAIAKAGAFDYLSSPVSVEQILEGVTQAGRLSRSRRLAPTDTHLDEVSGAFLASTVPAVQEMAALMRMVASHPDSNALILGESGVGKDIVTRLIHSLSPQSRGPFVVVNLVDVPPEQLEERLFGTAGPEGALETSQRPGSFAVARGGTLVLHELSELAPELQPSVLHVVENGSFCPLRGQAEVPFQARVLATTDHDISGLLDERSFSPSLFYRLASVMIHVPPLRERAPDIPRIAKAILEQVAADAGRPGMVLEPEALAVLSRHTWPGNIRELRNVLTRIALLTDEDHVAAASVSAIVGMPGMRDRRGGRRAKASSIPAPKISGVIAAALDEPSRLERERIEEALMDCGGHRERAAEALGMSRTTLWTRMRLLGIDAGFFSKRRAR